jgi:hypothetical protein
VNARLLIATVCLALACRAATPVQESGESTRQLVAALTRDSSFCRTPPPERKLALELLGHGPAAKPFVEEALAALESHGVGKRACGAEWLLYVYARLEGERAYPRLRRLLDNENLRVLHREIENSMAVSLDLTSIVTNVDAPGAIIPFPTLAFHGLDGYVMPQTSLELFLLGWIKRDSTILRRALTPAALATFERAGGPAPATPDQPRGQSVRNLGFGLFLPEGMVEPAGIERKYQIDQPHPAAFTGTVELFANGQSCGKSAISFADLAARTGESKWRFVIDDNGLASLIAILKQCDRTGR